MSPSWSQRVTDHGHHDREGANLTVNMRSRDGQEDVGKEATNFSRQTDHGHRKGQDHLLKPTMWAESMSTEKIPSRQPAWMLTLVGIPPMMALWLSRSCLGTLSLLVVHSLSLMHLTDVRDVPSLVIWIPIQVHLPLLS